jgi:hypothetical protein
MFAGPKLPRRDMGGREREERDWDWERWGGPPRGVEPKWDPLPVFSRSSGSSSLTLFRAPREEDEGPAGYWRDVVPLDWRDQCAYSSSTRPVMVPGWKLPTTSPRSRRRSAPPPSPPLERERRRRDRPRVESCPPEAPPPPPEYG